MKTQPVDELLAAHAVLGLVAAPQQLAVLGAERVRRLGALAVQGGHGAPQLAQRVLQAEQAAGLAARQRHRGAEQRAEQHQPPGQPQPAGHLRTAPRGSCTSASSLESSRSSDLSRSACPVLLPQFRVRLQLCPNQHVVLPRALADLLTLLTYTATPHRVLPGAVLRRAGAQWREDHDGDCTSPTTRRHVPPASRDEFI
ncbi:DNA polymerase I, thermostable [Frankliniella fusca]|uniref:DNA polymerase I, thermostable n=1 Tax=Frankliniella fusca TaxID=407009 RepID=A0AAE1I621_9NEOP|nr:DNA polymerase I, thermostable [Frankliniella fusca]